MNLTGRSTFLTGRTLGKLAHVTTLSIVLAASLAPATSTAADQPKPYVAPSKMGINKDAMTMQECRDRLAAPKRARPPSDDPSIDKDAICVNMLGSDKATHKLLRKQAKPASAP